MAGTRKGKQGTSTSSVEMSPAAAKRARLKRERQERFWASLAGPVEVRKVEGGREQT